MNLTRRPSANGPAGSPTPRTRGARGATLVEYGLVMAFFVVVSIGAFQKLTEAGDQEVSRQADCIATRPAPPECQMRPAIVPTTTTIATTTSTTLPTTTTTRPATTTTRPPTTTTTASTTTTRPPTTTTTTRPPASSTVTFSTSHSGLTVTITATVRNGTSPVANATVNFDLADQRTWPGGTVSASASCTTSSSGTCSTTYTGSPGLFGLGRTQSVTVSVSGATANPPVGSLPASQTVNF